MNGPEAMNNPPRGLSRPYDADIASFSVMAYFCHFWVLAEALEK